MKHPVAYSSLLISILTLITSCSFMSNPVVPNDSASGTRSESDSILIAMRDSATRKSNLELAHFDVESINKDDEDPRSTVSVSYGGKIYPIDTIMGHAQLFTKESWEEMEIPTNAIEVCGCWWAGGGDYFYIIPSANGISVYVGYQDEGQEEPGYGWTLKKEISK